MYAENSRFCLSYDHSLTHTNTRVRTISLYNKYSYHRNTRAHEIVVRNIPIQLKNYMCAFVRV